MNDAERRRRELLEQTRSLYSDRKETPVVHPRYGSTYRYLYGREGNELTEDTKGGTFGIRLFLCVLIFAAFLTMDKQKQEVFHMDSNEIADQITKDLNLKEIWKAL